MAFIPESIKPFRLAALVAGAYFLFSIIYIFVSSHIAASSVISKEQLEYVELYKGSLFVLLTALLIFAALFFCSNACSTRSETAKSNAMRLWLRENRPWQEFSRLLLRTI